MTEPVWGLLGVVIGAILTGLFNWRRQSRQLAHEREMDPKARSAATVKEILTDMLNHRNFTDRTFEALRKRVGGYTDDEVRLFLHEIGAMKVQKDDGTEWWFLRERSDERNQKRGER